jgi:hypothetical protein
MTTTTIKYVQSNLYISTTNSKMAEITRKTSGNINYMDQERINNIVSNVTEFKKWYKHFKDKNH